MLKEKLKLNIGIKSIILLAICAALIAADLLTKHFAKLYVWDVKIIPGLVELDGNMTSNSGIAFSLLSGNPDVWQPILITLTFIMLVGLVGVFIFLPERHLLMKVVIAIVIAGAIGNLVDRLAFREVRDFIGLNMLFNKQRLVYCNIADFCITIGAVLAVLDLMFLGEWAVFPLTKAAKAAQAQRKEEELKQNSAEPAKEQLPAEQTPVSDETAEGDSGENK